MAKNDTIYSVSMDENRAYKVHLPKGYNDTTVYSTIYVLDGEQIGSIVEGISSYYEQLAKNPPSIVISIDQKGTRWKDCSYQTNGDLTKKGRNFMSFITSELITEIDQSYNTNEFRIIVGHSFTANFINYFFFEEPDYFTGYIAASPYFAKNVVNKLLDKATKLESYKLYQLTFAENDLSGHIKSVKRADKVLRKIQNNFFKYSIAEVENKTHLTMVPQSIDNGLLWVNQFYAPMSSNFNKKQLKKRKGEFLDYYISYYNRIEKIYGQTMSQRAEDVEFMCNIVSQFGESNELKEFGDFAIKRFPNFYAGYYLLGEYFQKRKEYENALNYYEKGYQQLGDDCLNKDQFYEDVEQMKQKLGRL
jgi:hypothetical protein